MTDYTDDYIIEAREHLDEMENHLLQLVQTPDDINILNNIFTDVHTIKGAAQFTGLSKSSELAHRVEDLLDLLREGAFPCDGEMVDLFIASRDKLAFLVNEIEQDRNESSDINDLTTQLSNIIEKHEVVNNEDNQVEDSVSDNNDKISSDSLEKFIAENKIQLEKILTLLESLTLNKVCDSEYTQLINSYENIANNAIPLNFEKTGTLAKESVVFLSSLEKNKIAVNDSILTLLNTIHERLIAISNEIELFQLEASPIDDLIELITTLAPIESEEAIDNNIDTSPFTLFIQSSRVHLVEIESDVLSLENDTHNPSAINSLIIHLNKVKIEAEPLGLDSIIIVCQSAINLLNQYIDNKVKISFPLMELMSEIEAQFLLSMTELENSGKLVLPIDMLLIHIQTLSEDLKYKNVDKDNKIETNNTAVNAEMIRLSGQTYLEQYDQELFDIFLQQLQSTLKLIQQHIKNKSSLSEYTKAINSLKSSANYMGYHKLVEFYQQWLERIADLADISDEINMLSHDLMNSYIDELLKTFPQLDQQIGSEKLKVKTDNNILEIEHELTPSPHQQDIETIDNSVLELTDNDLFNQLTEALESSTHQNLADDTMHELFDEMISVNELPSNEALNPKATSIQSINKQKDKLKIIKALEKPIQTKNNNDKNKVLKKSVRVDAQKIDTLMNQVGELIVEKGYFFQLFNELRLLQKDLRDNAGLNNKDLKKVRAFSFRFAEAIVSFGRTSNDLQEGVMKVRMLPIAQLFDRYPRLIHDLVHQTDKKVNLEVRGEDTELDKMIIEEISDPLIHLIRNAVDHGIETTQERIAAGKSETAQLLLEAYNESNHIVIEVSDDGRGIDPEKIKAKALSKSLFSDDELARMSQKELTHLIMLPGLSTAKQVSNTSGRGVGMDVVKKNIEKLNGILEIDSKVNVYTKMRLKIPLTLAIIRALQVRVGTSFFTIPLSNVEETLRVHSKDTSMMEGTKVIHLRGKTMPIIYLSQLFNIPSDQRSSEKFFVVTVNTGLQQIGLIVDELLGQAEVVIKPLVDYLQEKSGFSGATIIGDGKISLILDIYELIKMTTNKQTLRQKQKNLKYEASISE
jgi:two-component system chemotaxis sensor kinase CheA